MSPLAFSLATKVKAKKEEEADEMSLFYLY